MTCFQSLMIQIQGDVVEGRPMGTASLLVQFEMWYCGEAVVSGLGRLVVGAQLHSVEVLVKYVVYYFRVGAILLEIVPQFT